MLLVGSLVSVVLGPVLLAIALVTDLITKTKGLRRSRTVALISTLFLIDLMGKLLVTGAWIISPFGLGVQRRASQARYRWIMTFWTTTLFRTISRFVPLSVDLGELDESLLSGNTIIIGRHRSSLDAILPSVLFGNRGLKVLYTLKQDLQREPNIDIVGQRMGHVFVDRNPTDLDAVLEPIRELGGKVDDKTVAVIFPEGTFFSPKRKQRAIRALQERDPAHVSAAMGMQYLLPPRPAGTLALLEGAPHADVVVLGHVGFEPFGTIKQTLARIGDHHQVVIRAWRYARNTIPTDPAAQIDWLYERWTEMDEWIVGQHVVSTARTPTGTPIAQGGS